jgi:hypothetical protein
MDRLHLGMACKRAGMIPMKGMAAIEAAGCHRLVHWTNWERALAILEQRSIRGLGTPPLNLESFPHLLIEGWRNVNELPVTPQVALHFRCRLPARHRGEGTLLPEPGWLEVYSIQGTPWQCSVHPESDPLKLVGLQPAKPPVRRRWLFSEDGRNEMRSRARWCRALCSVKARGSRISASISKRAS